MGSVTYCLLTLDALHCISVATWPAQIDKAICSANV